MAVLDISVVGLALPVMARDLGAPLTTLAWVVLAYVLAITGLLLGFGRLADRVGRRRVYAAGLLVFMAASVACALAPNAAALIAARAVQGVGAAMMSANSAALLVAAFPATQRGRALGAFGAAVGAGLAFGPPLGGWLVHALSWHWLFVVNVPVGAIALALLLARVPADPPRLAAGAGRFDPLAAGAWSLGLVAVMLALSFASARGGAPRDAVIAGLAGAALLGVFVASERRARAPLLPWGDLRGPLGRALALTLIGQALSMATAILLPLQLEEVAGWDPARAGRWLAIPPLAALFFAPLAGRWADRFGARRLAVAGLMIAGAGALVMSGLGTENRNLLAGSALFGSGLGLFTVPNASAVMGAIPPERLGVAAGLQATARNLGIAAGTAAASAAVAVLYASATSVPLLGPHTAGDGHEIALARAVGLAFAGLAGLAAAGVWLAAAGPAGPAHAHPGT